MASDWKSQRKDPALCDLVAETVCRGRHTLQSGGANVVKGSLHKRIKCLHRGDNEHSECPLLATKLTVSGSEFEF